ncbi:exodeoxyribonuclease V subunit gamma [Methylophaga sp. 41_12_T18]|nr:exodeoxyribonuclease V subunit gamma [Methylophaga sp. 41_12_T18]
MLNVVYSNDMVQLAAQLAEIQHSDPLPPLEAETVIVQSNELARWLSLFLAQHQGVASNIEFPYPSAYIWTLFRRVLSGVPKQSPFSTDAMAWRIFELLPQCQHLPKFEPINAYLGSQDDPLKRYAISHRIADSFDQYLMYRPDWLQAWEQGETPHWQALLWQQLTAGEDASLHRASLLQQLHDYLLSTDQRPAGLPRRLAIIGVSALPPVYLKIFELMARHCDITLMFFSPSEAYWGDVVDKKTQAKRLAESQEEDLYFNSGHPLLASLGKQGQEMFEQLQECEHEQQHLFNPPQQTSLLGCLQHDIYALNDPELVEDKQVISVEDDSIQAHACHSAMREIEVLHDQLLALFERHPDLSPTDVVVMTPDIEVYAPWIDAVFARVEGEASQRYIPYGIADCGVRYQSPVLNAFITLLGLPQSRFDVETVLSLLECQAIQHRFALDDEQLTVIRTWLAETQTRWALSGEDKAKFDLPETDNNTWRAGLDRLLLGFAMPLTEQGEDLRLFEQQLAFDGISGERAATMAQLCAFVDSLDKLRNHLNRPRTAEQWQQTLNECLDNVFLPMGNDNHDESELLLLRKTIDKLVETTELAGFEQTLSLALVTDWLNGHLDTSQTLSRFMGHGVTFCGMVPMRSIPFDVVCLIGMNDDSYPRRQPTAGFDLLSHDYRLGDRSRRDDDRYLFLEALLSCQRHLYLSYVGASIHDNATIPPSVLVSDLRDVLKQSYQAEHDEDIWSQLLTQHPLQAFSPRYFDGVDPKLFSFEQAQCPNAQAVEVDDWFATPLPEVDASWRQVSLSQLLNFFRHPARYLMRERMGIRLEMSDDQLETREPFALDGLQAWQLRQQLLTSRLNDTALAEMLPLVQATGVLPQGIMGEHIFDNQAGQVNEFADKLSERYPDSFENPASFELKLGEFYLSGQLEQLHEGGIFQYRMAKTKGNDLLALWLQHLVLNCVQPKGIAKSSQLFTEDNEYEFAPVAEAESHLSTLLDYYWQGLHQPLAYIPNSSFAFAKASLNSGKASPDNKMFDAWNGGQFSNGDVGDDYYQQIYQTAPLDEHFKQLAMAIFEPIQEHLVGGKL